MPASPREEELGRGERGTGREEAPRPASGGASPGLIVWVVTRRIEHETVVLGVKASEVDAAHLVDDDIQSEGFPKTTVVRYGIDSHSVT